MGLGNDQRQRTTWKRKTRLQPCSQERRVLFSKLVEAPAELGLQWWESVPSSAFCNWELCGGGAAGGPSLSPSVAERHPTQRCRPTFLLVSAFPPGGTSPGKKLLCQTSAWDTAWSSAGTCHSCEVLTCQLLPPGSSSQMCTASIQGVTETA